MEPNILFSLTNVIDIAHFSCQDVTTPIWCMGPLCSYYMLWCCKDLVSLDASISHAMSNGAHLAIT